MFVPPHGGARATAIAIFNIFGAVGGFIGPTLLGKLSDAGGDYSKAMLVLGAMDLASALMFLGAPRAWTAMSCCPSKLAIGKAGSHGQSRALMCPHVLLASLSSGPCLYLATSLACFSFIWAVHLQAGLQMFVRQHLWPGNMHHSSWADRCGH